MAGTTTGPLPDNFKVVVTIPEGWTPTNGARSETLLLLLNAPASYSNQPTQIGLHSLLGYFATQTPEELAKGFYGPSTHATVPSVELIGDVRHCNVQGDQGAFFEYAQGDRHGYLVLFLHEHYLYGLRVEGKDGLDPSAVRDAKRVLGSWHWTVTSPPPH